MSPVQTRSRKSSQLQLAATTTKEMVLLKQSSRSASVIHRCANDISANGSKGTTCSCRMPSPIVIPIPAPSAETRSSSSASSSNTAAILKGKGQVISAICSHDMELEYKQRVDRDLLLENVCSVSASSSRFAGNISATDVVVEGGVPPPPEWSWDEESCSTPKAIEFRIPEEACLACPPAPRKRKAVPSFHMPQYPAAFFCCSPPLLPHYVDINNFLLSVENSSPP